MPCFKVFAQLPEDIESKVIEIVENGEYDKAISLISANIKKADCWALNTMGYCYERKGDFRNAINWYEKVICYR